MGLKRRRVAGGLEVGRSREAAVPSFQPLSRVEDDPFKRQRKEESSKASKQAGGVKKKRFGKDGAAAGGASTGKPSAKLTAALAGPSSNWAKLAMVRRAEPCR